MVEFDLFDLVHMQDNWQHLKDHLLYQPILYTLYYSPVNNIIIDKNQQCTINTKTFKLLNDSAKNILHGSNKLLATSYKFEDIYYIQ